MNPGEQPLPPPPEEEKLARLFASLPDETIYQIALLMHLGRGDFDFTGRNLGIIRPGRTLADLAGDTDNALTAQRRGLLEEPLRQIRRIEDRLGAAFAVANIDEDKSAEVAPGMDPAG